jgi:hypothetical protein
VGVIDVDWDKFLTILLTGLTPVVPHCVLLAAVITVIGAPLPGGGPRQFQRGDPWRRFKYGSRDVIMCRAGHRWKEGSFWPGDAARKPPQTAITCTRGHEAGRPCQATARRCAVATTRTREP